MNLILSKHKRELVYWARKLNARGLVAARSGNISKRASKGRVYLTCTGSYLGELSACDIVGLTLDGQKVSGRFDATSEKELHLSVYRKFDDTGAVIHAHSPNTVAFFSRKSALDLTSFEAEIYLGNVETVHQTTPTVTDTVPVIAALEKNNIVVLGHHGVIARGLDLAAAYALVEVLEEQAKINIALGNYR